MASTYLASTLLMGALAVLVLVAVVRSRRWYHYSPEPDEDTQVTWGQAGEARPPRLEQPTGWILGFFALVLAAVGGVFAFVTNPAAPAGLLSGPVVAVAALLLGLYLLLGVYTSAKQRGHPDSIAAAETATVFSALFLAAVAAQLIG